MEPNQFILHKHNNINMLNIQLFLERINNVVAGWKGTVKLYLQVHGYQTVDHEITYELISRILPCRAVST